MVDLKRFVKGYMCYYDQALAEIEAGEQKGHWIFMVFPQLRELGYSAEAKTYGIEDRAEAEEFMRDPSSQGTSPAPAGHCWIPDTPPRRSSDIPTSSRSRHA